FVFSSRRRHTRFSRDWSSDVCASDLAIYSSDSICCRDYRDVDPDHPERGAALPAPDGWPASRIASLPPRDRWIVAGALPEALAEIGRASCRERVSVTEVTVTA